MQVADFGISRVKDPTKSYLSATNNNGTPMYMAPEQFNGSHLDEKVLFDEFETSESEPCETTEVVGRSFSIVDRMNELILQRMRTTAFDWLHVTGHTACLYCVSAVGMRSPLGKTTAKCPVQRLATWRRCRYQIASVGQIHQRVGA